MSTKCTLSLVIESTVVSKGIERFVTACFIEDTDVDNDNARWETHWLFMTEKTTPMVLLTMGMRFVYKDATWSRILLVSSAKGTFDNSLQFHDRIVSSVEALEGGGLLRYLWRSEHF